MPFVLLIGAAILAYALASSSGPVGKVTADGMFEAHDPLTPGGLAWASLTPKAQDHARQLLAMTQVASVESQSADGPFVWHLTMDGQPDALSGSPNTNQTLHDFLFDTGNVWRVWISTMGNVPQLVLINDGNNVLAAPFALLTTSANAPGGKGWS